jgi:hypothetical protein
MADSSTEEMLSSDEEFCQKRCYVCVSPAKKSTVVTCNNKTWARFIEFVLQWQHLEGSQAEIAQSFVQAHAADIERYGNCMDKLYGQKNTRCSPLQHVPSFKEI